MDELNSKQKLAYKYYRAYGALCGHVEESKNYSEDDLQRLKDNRAVMFGMYKRYDPDNSFDVSKNYNL